MSKNEKNTFVLIHGAFYGGWVWRDVVRGLRQMGHAVTAPTLAGLGERRHLEWRTASLATHIEDVVAHIEMEDLNDVSLVGWSYGGMVSTGVFARLQNKIKSMIYLDAFVPDDGKALIDYQVPRSRAIAETSKEQDFPIPPYPVEHFGVTDPAIVDFIKARQSPQPWRTFFEPVKLPRRPTIPISYIRCMAFKNPPFDEALNRMRADPAVRVTALDAGHLCMLTNPQETINSLTDAS